MLSLYFFFSVNIIFVIFFGIGLLMIMIILFGGIVFLNILLIVL